MRYLLTLTLLVIALTGCITQNSYNDSNEPVVENEIDTTSAARTRIALALQYLNTHNNAQAKYNLERAAEFSPNLPEVHYSFAYYYQKVGENTRANQAYQKALLIKPDDPNTLNNYGVFLCSIKQYALAQVQFLKAINIPSYIRVAQSYENLALCAIEYNDFIKAEGYLKQAINHSAQQNSATINLAALYYAKNEVYKAHTLLMQYINSGQISSRILMLKFLLNQRMGNTTDAEKTSRSILHTYPKSNEAQLLHTHKISFSEFEILRDKYRQAILNEFKNRSTKQKQTLK